MTPPIRIAHGIVPALSGPTCIPWNMQPLQDHAGGTVPALHRTGLFRHGDVQAADTPRVEIGPAAAPSAWPVRTAPRRTGPVRSSLRRRQGLGGCAQAWSSAARRRPEKALASFSASIETGRPRFGIGTETAPGIAFSAGAPARCACACRAGKKRDPARAAQRDAKQTLEQDVMQTHRHHRMRTPMHDWPNSGKRYPMGVQMGPTGPDDRPRPTPIPAQSATHRGHAPHPAQAFPDPARLPRDHTPIRHQPWPDLPQPAAAWRRRTGLRANDPVVASHALPALHKALHRAVPGRCTGAGGWAVHRSGAVRCRLSDAGGRT